MTKWGVDLTGRLERIVRRLVVLLSCMALGCSFEMVPHDWQVRGTQDEVVVSTRSWRKIERGDHCRVEGELREQAVSRLSDVSAVKLSASELNDHCPELSSKVGEESPYLVRGVAEGAAWCSLVRYDEASRQLFVYQAWYNGENLLFVGGEVQASPVVVLLPSEPSLVFPVGQELGDIIGSTECYRDEIDYEGGRRKNAQ